MPPCGGVFDAPTGNITSLDYPARYPNGLDCTWSIRRAEQEHIRIYFDDFQLASNDRKIYVKLFDFAVGSNDREDYVKV